MMDLQAKLILCDEENDHAHIEFEISDKLKSPPIYCKEHGFALISILKKGGAISENVGTQLLMDLNVLNIPNTTTPDVTRRIMDLFDSMEELFTKINDIEQIDSALMGNSWGNDKSCEIRN